MLGRECRFFLFLHIPLAAFLEKLSFARSLMLGASFFERRVDTRRERERDTCVGETNSNDLTYQILPLPLCFSIPLVPIG